LQAGLPVWANAGGTINFWQENIGALSPLNITDDLLLGATATGSAKFAFTNVAGGTPTASVSAGATGATSLSANGILSTTNKQTLQLGNTNTGNIDLFGFGAGVIQSNAAGFLSTGSIDLSSATNVGSSILGVGNGGTGLASLASGSLVYGSGGSAALSALSITGSSGECLISNGSIPQWQACPGSGSGSSKWTLSSNVIYPNTISNQVGIGTTTAGNIISSFYVTRDLASGALGKALAIFNQTENQDIIAASASGTTKFALTNSGNLEFAGGTSFLNTINSAATAARTYTLPDTTGTVCIFEAGNCAGTGSGVTASGGNAHYLAEFSNAQTITDSILYDTGSSIGIGTITPTAKLDVNGTASISGELALYGTPQIQSTALQTLLLGGTTTGDIQLKPGNSGSSLYLASSGLVGIGTTLPFATLDIRSNSSAKPVASLSGATSFASAVIDQSGSGDLFTASKSGASKFTVLNNGNVQINNFGTGVVQSGATGILSSSALNLGSASLVSGQLGVVNGGTGINASSVTNGQLLIGNSSNGFTLGTLTGGAGINISNSSGSITISQTGLGASQFTEDDSKGILYPNMATVDLLFGGATTSSAKFAFLNNAGGTPTASVSAG
ncbi:MAG TPA: hypothetical protein VNZ86_05520, partial [Bacteroidia bacterium]|nr:hypothetical protein [Bacteroidia bacterium]